MYVGRYDYSEKEVGTDRKKGTKIRDGERRDASIREEGKEKDIRRDRRKRCTKIRREIAKYTSGMMWEYLFRKVERRRRKKRKRNFVGGERNSEKGVYGLERQQWERGTRTLNEGREEMKKR